MTAILVPPQAVPIAEGMPGLLFDRVWFLFLVSLAATVNSIPAPAADGWTVTTPDGSNNVALDLSAGLNLVLTLTATAVTFLAPTFTGGTIAAGSWFNLWLEQDATGGRDVPTYTLGAGAFADDPARAQVDGTATMRTCQTWRYDGILWTLQAWRTGVSIA